MTQRKEPAAHDVPAFRDVTEAATFWDTHSPLDYPDTFQEVQVNFARPLIKRALTIELDQTTIDELRALAQERGLGPSTLARMWILEQLRQERQQTAGTDRGS